MSQTGWYPDPGGEPNRYRFWDGRSWSAQTTHDPRQPAPGLGAPPPRENRDRRFGAIIAILAIVLIVVMVAVVALGNRQRPTVTNDPLPPDPTRSAWNDTSPSPSETPTPTPEATPSPEPTPSETLEPPPSEEPPQQRACVSGSPDIRADHPVDGRVYGGNLSFPAAPEMGPAEPEPRFSFAWDVTQQTLGVSDAGWIAQLAVGQLQGPQAFDGTARETVDALIQCLVTSDMYNDVSPERTDLRSEAITISGKKGWLIETNIIVDKPGLEFAGDHTIFVVVKDGDHWGMFFGAVPTGDDELAAVMNRAVRELRAS